MAFAEEARQQLLHFDWPGNVRELERFVSLLTMGEHERGALETVRELLVTARSERTTDQL